MSKLFTSNNNIKLLKEVIYDKYKDEPSIELNQNHLILLNSIMNYVKSKVSSTVPTGYTEISYTKLMNNKILKLFYSKIEEYKIQSKNEDKTSNDKLNNYSNQNNQYHLQNERDNIRNVFDSVIDKSNSMPDNFLPPPQLQSHEQLNNTSIKQNLEQVQLERQQLEPKEHTNNIDFTVVKKEEEPMPNQEEQTKLYNDMIQQRGITISNETQPNIHNQINLQQINQQQTIDEIHTNQDNNQLNSFPLTDNNVNHLYDNNGQFRNDEYTIDDVINNNEQHTLIENINNQSTLIENINNQSNMHNGIRNNLDRNDSNLIIEEHDDPKNLFYQKDREIEEELHKINTKTLSEHYESPVILPKQVKTYQDDFYITIDSKDRNLEIYPNPSEFQVKFSPASDSIERQELLDSNNNIIYETTVKYIGNPSGASISNSYTNILEIKLLHCIVPLGINWICGNSPKDYYNGECDDSNQNSICIPYGPKYTADTGIAVSVLNEPYLLLDINELTGPYQGTNDANSNAFAKLVLSSDWKRDYFFSQISSFVYMSTAGSETYKYRPTNLGTIDKMTLKLKNYNNDLYNFGNDKLYIEYLCKGSKNKKTGKENVKVVVQGSHKDYIDSSIEEIDIVPGELLYFYDTRPTEAHMIKFHQDLHITCMDVLKKRELNKYSLGVCKKDTIIDDTVTLDNTICNKKVKTDSNFKRVDKKQKYIKINAAICKINNRTDVQSDIEGTGDICEEKEYKVNFSHFLEVGNYLGIVYKNSTTEETYSELLKVYCVDGFDVIVMKPKSYVNGIEYEILRFGFAENYNRGMTSPNKMSLFSKSGKRACCVKEQCNDSDCEKNNGSIDKDLSFEIDFPYEDLPEYIQNGEYFENEIFFIQQKLQISYTLKLTEVRKEDKDFRSLLVNNS